MLIDSKHVLQLPVKVAIQRHLALRTLRPDAARMRCTELEVEGERLKAPEAVEGRATTH